MANNCLYSLPCCNNKNYVHYDLKQKLYCGRAINEAALGIWQEAASVRALDCSAFYFLSLPPYFVLSSAQARREASGEEGQRVFSSLGCMHFLVPGETAARLPSGMAAFRGELIMTIEGVGRFLQGTASSVGVGLHLRQRDLNEVHSNLCSYQESSPHISQAPRGSAHWRGSPTNAWPARATRRGDEPLNPKPPTKRGQSSPGLSPLSLTHSFPSRNAGQEHGPRVCGHPGGGVETRGA